MGLKGVGNLYLSLPGPTESCWYKIVSPGRVFFVVLCGRCLDGKSEEEREARGFKYLVETPQKYNR